MRTQRRFIATAVPLLLSLTGCGYVHVGRLPGPVTTVVGDEKLLKENADLQLEKKMLQQELALTRAQGDALRMAIENRTADGDTSKRLVEKLNETSKELAALRASYAQLQAERSESPASEAVALKARLGEAEEKLASSLRNYTALQEEIGRLKSDVARTREENVALSEQVKSVTAQNAQAQAALAQLNADLLAQKDARVRAEQDAETLRTELKTIAPDSSTLARQRTGAAADARSLVAEHAAETASLKQDLETLRVKVDALTAERSELMQKLAAAATASAASLAHVEARLATALQSESTLRTENVRLKTTGAQLAAQLAQAKSAPADAAASDVRSQLLEAQSQVASLTEENAKLKARLAQASPSEAPLTPPPAAAVAASGAPVVVPAAITVSPNSNGITVRPSGVSATLVTSVPASRAATPVARTEPPAAGRVHTVAGGDTLAKISAQYYGTPGRWGDILAANRDVLGEHNNLVIGRTLRIP